MRLGLPEKLCFLYSAYCKIDISNLFKLHRPEMSNRNELNWSTPTSRSLYPHQSVTDRKTVFDERLVPTKRMRNLPHEQFSKDAKEKILTKSDESNFDHDTVKRSTSVRDSNLRANKRQNISTKPRRLSYDPIERENYRIPDSTRVDYIKKTASPKCSIQKVQSHTNKLRFVIQNSFLLSTIFKCIKYNGTSVS